MPKNKKNIEDKKGRVHRARHEESDSDSSVISESTNYRALRDEEKPLSEGLQPPEGADPTKTAFQHVSAGSRAKKKSDFVSTTKSKRTAIAWAAFMGKEGKGRVAKIKASSDDMDISTSKGVKEHLGVDKGSAYNNARASKEVLTKGGIDKSRVREVNDVERVTQSTARMIRDLLKEGKEVEYNDRLVAHAQISRAKATESGKPLSPHGAVVYKSSIKRSNSSESLSSNSSSGILNSEASKEKKVNKKNKKQRKL